MKTEAKNWTIAILLILLWGTSWPVNKVAISYCSPEYFVLLRILSGITFLLIIYSFKFKSNGVVKLLNRRISKYDLLIIIVGAIFQISLFLIFINIGLQYVGAGTASTVAYTTPFFVYPFSILIFKEKRFLSIDTLGFICGVLGVALIFITNYQYNLLGIIYLLLAALSMSIGICIVKIITNLNYPKLMALETIILQLAISTIIVWVWFIIRHRYTININPTLIFCVAYCGLFATGIGFLLLNYLTSNTPSYFVSSIIVGVPLVGNLISGGFDQIKLINIAGTILIWSGCLIIALHCTPKVTGRLEE